MRSGPPSVNINRFLESRCAVDRISGLHKLSTAEVNGFAEEEMGMSDANDVSLAELRTRAGLELTTPRKGGAHLSARGVKGLPRASLRAGGKRC